MQFPFPVREKAHPSARYIRISVNATGEVLLTIPRQATKTQAREFLASRVEWVQAQLAKLRTQAPRASSPHHFCSRRTSGRAHTQSAGGPEAPRRFVRA